ncbi:transcriptional regulator, TetR family [Leptospira ryugenii]|uniref:Transcriptional regulator, TetR family n=1 Tax=Leptospira ryugenii TaxID=1917863 RepID=A0A2P2DZ26_9LEPT|nr:TetR/AcrR family transcriptional regulator [Leptospira ryugenii]GBF49879.1 transcriptional regulator, TetR family [Leptospira ryugenii]
MDRLPLRERKKHLIKEAIAQSARELFSERPFSQVTVAEVADHANVSVKTLFTYFRSKDDLLFFEESNFCEEILAALANRKPGSSYLEAMQGFLWDLIHELQGESILGSFPGFHTSMTIPELQPRLSLLWDRYEGLIAEQISKDEGFEPADPEPRIIASLLLLPFRQLTMASWRSTLEAMNPSKRISTLEKWHSRTQSLIADGIRMYGRK